MEGLVEDVHDHLLVLQPAQSGSIIDRYLRRRLSASAA
jgi:hypothetical protein